jgi:hypothetical protein
MKKTQVKLWLAFHWVIIYCNRYLQAVAQSTKQRAKSKEQNGKVQIKLALTTKASPWR